MQSLYPLFLIIHIFCAIIFVGYLFFDVVLLRFAKKNMKKDPSDTLGSIGNVVSKFMPINVLILLLSGGLMASRYFVGPINSNLQILLIIKISIATIIFLMIAISLSCHYIFKCRNPLGKFIHPVVLTLCIIIIILAKIMFFV